MTRFVAALLVSRSPLIRSVVDPRLADVPGLGTLRSAALLTQAHLDGRAQRQADDDLMAEVAAALREVPGEGNARDAGAEAWRVHQQRGGES